MSAAAAATPRTLSAAERIGQALQQRPVQRRLVLAALVAYVGAFVVWWPNAIINADEACYVGQATLFTQGKTATDYWDQFYASLQHGPVSSYPPATSLLQAILVFIGGWRAAALLSVISLVGTVVLVLIWLERRGRSPLFALIPLLYLPLAVLGRVAISDDPNTFITTAAFLLFWMGLDGVRGAWLGAGLLAGLSPMFREVTPLVFVPLFAGALLRFRWKTVPLIAGGVVGLGIRSAVVAAMWGSALPPRFTGFWVLIPEHPFMKIALNVFALMVMVPGGLWAVLRYRGELWQEVLLSVLGFTLFYSMYYYDAHQSMLAMQLILEPRFLAPVVPLIAFVMGDTIPRMVPGVRQWLGERPRVLLAGASLIAIGALLELVCIHPLLHRWGGKEAGIREKIYKLTTDDSFVVMNSDGVVKFTSYAFGSRRWVNRAEVPVETVANWSRAGSDVFLVFVNRNESADRRLWAADNQTFEQTLGKECAVTVLADEQSSPLEHLHIARVSQCSPAGALRAEGR